MLHCFRMMAFSGVGLCGPPLPPHALPVFTPIPQFLQNLIFLGFQGLLAGAQSLSLWPWDVKFHSKTKGRWGPWVGAERMGSVASWAGHSFHSGTRQELAPHPVLKAAGTQQHLTYSHGTSLWAGHPVIT